MSQFKMTPLRLEGLALVEPFCEEDERGYFLKNYEKGWFSQQGFSGDLWECVESYSKRGALRGLHIQKEHPQAKLVRAAQGEIFSVAVDLRRHSPSFGQWQGVYLSRENRRSFLIRAGFAHGYLALSTEALVEYQSFAPYRREEESGIRWNDPTVGIEWPLSRVSGLVISQKDQQLPTLEQYRRELEGAVHDGT